MIRETLGSQLAIIGGGKFCSSLLQLLYDPVLANQRPTVLGVADIHDQAPGMRLARELGIWTTTDYTQFYRCAALETLLEITSDPDLAELIRRQKPAHLRLIDHLDMRRVWDQLRIAQLRLSAADELAHCQHDPAALAAFFERLMGRFSAIIEQRNLRSRQIEHELLEHEQSLEQIIQGSTIPTFVINRQHVITHWNKALEKLTGCSAEQAVGTTRQWAPFYPSARPSMADVVLDRLDTQRLRQLYGENWRPSALIEGAFEAEGFFPNLGPEGKWCWFTAAPIKSPDGRLIGAIETLWDTTAEKRAKDERERHNRELRTLLAIYTALSAAADIDLGIGTALQELQALLAADGIALYALEADAAFRLQQRIGLPRELCWPEQIRLDANLIRQMQQGQFVRLDAEASQEPAHAGPAGIVCLATASIGVPISSKERRLFGLLGIVGQNALQLAPSQRAVLELIGNRIGVALENSRLQAEVRQSEQRHRSLFDNDPNPIFLLDPQHLTILDINRRAQECYGYEKNQLLGRNFLELGNPGDNELRQGLRQLTPDRSLLFAKKRHYRRNGQPFFVNINVAGTHLDQGGQVIVTTTDITESVEAEAQLIQAGKMTTLGVMAAGMAHEINQPLSVIQVCADYLLKLVRRGHTPSAAELTEIANDIVANVRRAANVIGHVRAFSHHAEVERGPVDINGPVRDLFKVFGNQLKAHGIELVLELAPDLPLVLAEHNRLEQVFINLVSNAIDAMDEKSAQPETADAPKQLTIRTFATQGRVNVQVSDTGIGMNEQVRQKLFEPFFTTKQVGKGTGLGTSIGYGIVKDYGGSIEVESQPGLGTTFTVSFPVKP